MNRKFVIIVLVLATLVLVFYAYLGGFDQPEITVAKTKLQYVAGKYYEGPVNGKEFGLRFQEASQMVDNKKLAGTLTNIYYNNPEAQDDTIKAFIGVTVADTTQTIPAGYELQKLSGNRKVIEVTSNAHFLLAPNKMYPALFDYLKANNLKTKNHYLEQFPDKGPALLQAELLN